MDAWRDAYFERAKKKRTRAKERNPQSGELVAGSIEDQTTRVIANLRAVIEAAGSDLTRVVRTTVYVTDLSLFARVNAVYAAHFTGTPAPARATVEVAALPLGAQVEIDAIALAPTG